MHILLSWDFYSSFHNPEKVNLATEEDEPKVLRDLNARVFNMFEHP